MPVIDIVHKTDVNTDIYTYWPKNSTPRNISDVNLDSRLREGMSHTKIFEQSVLGEGLIVRPEAADMSERHHERTCLKSSARPTTVIDIVHNADVNTDKNTDQPDNSAPMNISDVNLFKWQELWCLIVARHCCRCL